MLKYPYFRKWLPITAISLLLIHNCFSCYGVEASLLAIVESDKRSQEKMKRIDEINKNIKDETASILFKKLASIDLRLIGPVSKGLHRSGHFQDTINCLLEIIIADGTEFDRGIICFDAAYQFTRISKDKNDNLRV